jgi:hypothetical protein
MESNLKEIIEEYYPSSNVMFADFSNNELRIVLEDGQVRWYGFEGDTLYCYKPKSITGDSNIQKFKSIFREAKINQIIE